MSSLVETFEGDLGKLEIKEEYKEWPVVYLLLNDKDIYVGETNDIEGRIEAHKSKIRDNKFKYIKIIFSKKFHKSAIYDIETKLINYLFTDKKFNITNKGLNQKDLNYYNKNLYSNDYFNKIWSTLKQLKLVNKDLESLENEFLFKYSPFKALSSEQYKCVESVLSNIFVEKYVINDDEFYETENILNYTLKEEKTCSVINGSPGTGKTLIAIKILKIISELTERNSNVIGFCLPQASMRNEIKSLIKLMKITNIKVISPSNIKDTNYDILVIDEAHRLKEYTGIFSLYPFHLEIDKENNIYTNELELAIKQSKHLILLFDEFQKVRDSDISNFKKHLPNWTVENNLSSQFRVKAGTNYINVILNILQIKEEKVDFNLGEYDIKFVDSIEELHKLIIEKEKIYTRCRMSSGYYVKLDKKNRELRDEGKYCDFEAEGYKINWNTKLENWFNSDNAINEIGCIHTLQGYDLNYIGVIFGDEITYNVDTKRIEIIPENYKDRNSFPLRRDPLFYEKLEATIKDIYYVLMTRGIRGTYLYVKDKNLEKYLKESLKIS